MCNDIAVCIHMQDAIRIAKGVLWTFWHLPLFWAPAGNHDQRLALQLRDPDLCLVFAIATIAGVASSMRSYQQWHFYTHVEEDFSIAEIYEVELWFEVPATILGLAATLGAAAPMYPRTEVAADFTGRMDAGRGDGGLCSAGWAGTGVRRRV